MGANTLSSIETCFNESINQPISRYSGDHKGSLYSRSDPFSWDIFIASGGDDQAITGCSATINFTPLEVEEIFNFLPPLFIKYYSLAPEH